MPVEDDAVLRSALFRGDSLEQVDSTQKDDVSPNTNPFIIDVQPNLSPISAEDAIPTEDERDDDSFVVHSSISGVCRPSTLRKRTRKEEIKRNVGEEDVDSCINNYRSIQSSLFSPPVVRKDSRHPRASKAIRHGEIESTSSFDSNESGYNDRGAIPNLSPLTQYGIGSDEGYAACHGRFSFNRSPIAEISHLEDDDDDCATKIRRLTLDHDTVYQSMNTLRAVTQQQKKENMNMWQDKHQQPINFYPLQDVTSFSLKNSHPSLQPISAFVSPPVPRRKRIDVLTPPHSPNQKKSAWREKTPMATPLLKRKTKISPLSRNDNIEKMAVSREEKSRLAEDFETIGTLGDGFFGTVYKCISRLDGYPYAVKAIKCQVRGKSDRDRMLKEVYALAALSDSTDTAAFHIVGYHQAWMEENRLYIQTELCTSTLMEEMKKGGPICHDKSRQFKMLREMLLALDLIHRNKMVHLDIKPDNIFIKNDLFKIGDFGLVTKLSVRGDVEEGDSRYMCNDLLQGNHDDLTKCDIFSLGATMYEISLRSPLPADGEEWHQIRSGIQTFPSHTPKDLCDIIKVMMHPKRELRPSAPELLKRRQLLSKDQKRLILEKNKVRQAMSALADRDFRLKQLSPRKPLVRATSLNL